ncbi:uncharacterized protein A4U43_C04F18760 [Asparagus officinalis]|uniref:Uncharacterized protein n=1 Tax=Asparagus officinalis TaxID=4686 RepID=A0A5P1F202_ASPOF|nr:uncharacterized protein A4U43_C04F18760 [Asparagus officinalis]
MKSTEASGSFRNRRQRRDETAAFALRPRKESSGLIAGRRGGGARRGGVAGLGSFGRARSRSATQSIRGPDAFESGYELRAQIEPARAAFNRKPLRNPACKLDPVARGAHCFRPLRRVEAPSVGVSAFSVIRPGFRDRKRSGLTAGEPGLRYGDGREFAERRRFDGLNSSSRREFNGRSEVEEAGGGGGGRRRRRRRRRGRGDAAGGGKEGAWRFRAWRGAGSRGSCCCGVSAAGKRKERERMRRERAMREKRTKRRRCGVGVGGRMGRGGVGVKVRGRCWRGWWGSGGGERRRRRGGRGTPEEGGPGLEGKGISGKGGEGVGWVEGLRAGRGAVEGSSCFVHLSRGSGAGLWRGRRGRRERERGEKSGGWRFFDIY